MTGPPLPRSWFARPAEAVARDLLGTTLAVVGRDGVRRSGRIVETEAYVGPHDLACHAAKGRTARTSVMFGPGGFAYVYLVYGMHELFNVVTGEEGDAQAVLVRSVLPGDGVLGPRGETRGVGPGRLTRLLDVDRRLYGAPLDGPQVTLHAGSPPTEVVVTPRIGVDYAGAWAAAPLRFVDPDGFQRAGGSLGGSRSSGNSSRGERRSSRTPST